MKKKSKEIKRKKSVNEKSMTPKQIKKFLNSLPEWTPIKVNWNDAFSKRGWIDKEDISREALEVENVGYFIKVDTIYVYMGNGSTSDHASITDLWGIPLGMVRKITKL